MTSLAVNNWAQISRSLWRILETGFLDCHHNRTGQYIKDAGDLYFS